MVHLQIVRQQLSEAVGVGVKLIKSALHEMSILQLKVRCNLCLLALLIVGAACISPLKYTRHEYSKASVYIH